MSDSSVRVNDKVRVSFEGIVTELDDHGKVAMVRSDLLNPKGHYVPGTAEVTVVKMADHPSRDLPGVYRIAQQDEVPLVKVRENRWVTARDVDADPMFFTDEEIATIAGPVAGVIPHTPAYQALNVENTPV